MKAIIVTGTPGTGKTTVAKELAQRERLRYIDVNLVIRKERLSEGRDHKRDCEIIDTKRLAKALGKVIESSRKRCVIDSHLSQCLPKKAVELCIVTRCDLQALSRRLKKRGYSAAKVRENLDSEIFDICLIEALDKGHRVVVVETGKRINYRMLRENFI